MLSPIRISRFWSNVEKMSPDECWNWTACLANGYGQFRMNGKIKRAHHVSFYLHYGRWPEPDRVLMHTCDNKRCVNPSHFREATQLDNIADATAKGIVHHTCGERHGKTKLTKEQVLLVRELASKGTRGVDLARQFNTTKYNISDIVRRRTWKHI